MTLVDSLLLQDNIISGHAHNLAKQGDNVLGSASLSALSWLNQSCVFVCVSVIRKLIGGGL